MSTYYHSFTELFKLKIKKANLLIIFGLIGSFALTLFNYYGRNEHGQRIVLTPSESFLSKWLEMFILVAFMLFLIFYCLTYVSHQQVNQNQTWRAIPISSPGLYMDNMLSSFAAAFVFAIYEFFVFAILVVIRMFGEASFRQSIFASFKEVFTASPANLQLGLSSLFEGITITILIGFFFYFLADFLILISRSIADFVPGRTGRKFIQIISVVLILLLADLFVRGNKTVMRLVAYPFAYVFGGGVYTILSFNTQIDNPINNFPLAFLVILALNLLFLLINLFLFRNFYEARERN